MIYKLLKLILCLALASSLYSQDAVPILDYQVNFYGQAELTIDSEEGKYYLLSTIHEPDRDYELYNYMSIGTGDPLVIRETLSAYPIENYTVTAYSVSTPGDIDGDGIDDVTEYENRPSQSPLNFGKEVMVRNGRTCLISQDNYEELSVVSPFIEWAPFLNDQQFVKFAIINIDSEEPQVYFINSKNHEIHFSFYDAVGLDFEQNITSGEIVYNPNFLSPNGRLGKYYFNFSFGESLSFERTQKTYELLAANMPFLQNNFEHFIGGAFESLYDSDNKSDFEGSRINVILESDLLGDVDYIPFNLAEGYGLLRLMTQGETPNSRDIVIYESLPNSLPRVGGIITSVLQTPLSHVNLRAIQDKVPNAYIKNPLENEAISNLIDKYIYYSASEDEYIIREASLEEVNNWYEKLRPTEDQIPERDLSQTKILPLDDIDFYMSNIFGAKCSNVATMRNFGFPEGTIPNGFGVPFYFYDEFMKHNNFYTEVENLISEPDFINNLQVRIDKLDDLRDDIKDADMPQWMLDELDIMHKSFPVGTSVRCRSSTNNEDLPGFSGAGLYTSKTQHPDEGHMSKSIKQVFASMWNLRAYEEREFYRVDHFSAAMGVLCHPNYKEEKSNGVGISIDPIYMTQGNFYLNTQVGEALVTNPNADEIPEEILLSADPDLGFQVLRRSNLVGNGGLVMDETYLSQLRSYLQVIHNEFATLYDLENIDGFGMDIEYKVTKQDQLIIKQARPWVSFWADIKSNFDLAAIDLVEPESSATLSNAETIKALIKNTGLEPMVNFEIDLVIDDLLMESITVSDTLFAQQSSLYSFAQLQDFSITKDYNIEVIVSDISDGYSRNDTLRKIITKLHPLEASIAIAEVNQICDNEILIIANLNNLGADRIEDFEIEASANGVIIETFGFERNIRSGSDLEIEMQVTSELNENDNEILLRLTETNGQNDAIQSNNTDTILIDKENVFRKVTLEVNIDDFPDENRWELVDIATERIVASGDFPFDDFEEELCVSENSCYIMRIYDLASDGICCDYGIGNFRILNDEGSVLVANNGRFGSLVEEIFCPNDQDCILSVDIETTNSSSAINDANGEIVINILNGIEPFSYSIDGGLNFGDSPAFVNLAPGTYDIVVQDAIIGCFYEETIIIESEGSNTQELPQHKISIYPNPTTEEVFIKIKSLEQTNSTLNLEVYNILGHIVDKTEINTSYGSESFRYTFKEVPDGSYYFRFHDKKAGSYIKVIKM